MTTLMWLFATGAGGSAVGAWIGREWPWLVLFVVFSVAAIVFMLLACIPDRRWEQ